VTVKPPKGISKELVRGVAKSVGMDDLIRPAEQVIADSSEKVTKDAAEDLSSQVTEAVSKEAVETTAKETTENYKQQIIEWVHDAPDGYKPFGDLTPEDFFDKYFDGIDGNGVPGGNGQMRPTVSTGSRFRTRFSQVKSSIASGTKTIPTVTLRRPWTLPSTREPFLLTDWGRITSQPDTKLSHNRRQKSVKAR